MLISVAASLRSREGLIVFTQPWWTDRCGQRQSLEPDGAGDKRWRTVNRLKQPACCDLLVGKDRLHVVDWRGRNAMAIEDLQPCRSGSEPEYLLQLMFQH